MARPYPDHPHPSQCHYIQRVGNAGEYRVPGTTFTIDGFHRETNTVYEFHGCFWHGCPKCYSVRDETHLCLCHRTMQDVYNKTQQKMRQLLNKGYNVFHMWECEWTRLKQTRPDIQTYVNSCKSWNPSTLATPFAGDALMPSNSTIT